MKKPRKKENDFERSSNDYFKEISRFSPLSKEEEMKLWEEYKKNNSTSARDKIIKANLKFVAGVASQYIGMGLSYPDLISEGNIGLMKAMDKFKYEKGNKTISYAVWWIRQTILEALKKRNLINGDDSEFNLDIGDDFSEQSHDDETFNPTDEKYIDDGGFNVFDEMDCTANVISLLDCLNEREQIIIKKYFGIDTEKSMTLEEIGKSMNLTKERIRQIKESALKKMRSEALKKSITSEIYR